MQIKSLIDCSLSKMTINIVHAAYKKPLFWEERCGSRKEPPPSPPPPPLPATVRMFVPARAFIIIRNVIALFGVEGQTAGGKVGLRPQI